MQNYVLRIYRRDALHPWRIVGIVEDVDSGTSMAFKDIHELMTLLSGDNAGLAASGAGNRLRRSGSRSDSLF
jgi:hypothetical protein